MSAHAPYLCEATRFKLNFTARGNTDVFAGWRHRLEGRWVALVPAEDDSHVGRVTRLNLDMLKELREAQAAASEACAQLFDLAEREDAAHAVRDAKQAVLHLQASQHRLRAAIAKAEGAAA